MKFGHVVQEEMSFKEKVYAQRTDEGQRQNTIAHLELKRNEILLSLTGPCGANYRHVLAMKAALT